MGVVRVRSRAPLHRALRFSRTFVASRYPAVESNRLVAAFACRLLCHGPFKDRGMKRFADVEEEHVGWWTKLPRYRRDEAPAATSSHRQTRRPPQGTNGCQRVHLASSSGVDRVTLPPRSIARAAKATAGPLIARRTGAPTPCVVWDTQLFCRRRTRQLSLTSSSTPNRLGDVQRLLTIKAGQAWRRFGFQRGVMVASSPSWLPA